MAVADHPAGTRDLVVMVRRRTTMNRIEKRDSRGMRMSELTFNLSISEVSVHGRS